MRLSEDLEEAGKSPSREGAKLRPRRFDPKEPGTLHNPVEETFLRPESPPVARDRRWEFFAGRGSRLMDIGRRNGFSAQHPVKRLAVEMKPTRLPGSVRPFIVDHLCFADEMLADGHERHIDDCMLF